MKKKLEELKKRLAALKDRIEADDQEAIKEGVELKSKIEDLKNQIAQAEEKSALLNMIGTKEQEDAPEKKRKARSLGEHFVMNLPEKHSNRFQIAAPEFKAYNDNLEIGTVLSPQVPRELVTDIDRNIVPEVLPATVLRGLFGAETISGNALTFFTEGAIEVNSGSSDYGFDVTAEGAKKPQISFDDPTPVTVALDKLAAFIKETDEYIEDAPFLASAINGRLMNYLRLREEAYLLAALAGTSGIQTDTAGWLDADMNDAQAIADLIFEKIQAVQSQSGFAADAILMHPSVWATLRLGKDGDNRYIGGGYFADGQVKTLWGVPVYTSTFVDAPVSGSAVGDIYVGSFKACASVVSKGGVRVEATNTDADDFQKNRMTIRAEERLALAVRRPAGFVKITKAAAPSP